MKLKNAKLLIPIGIEPTLDTLKNLEIVNQKESVNSSKFLSIDLFEMINELQVSNYELLSKKISSLDQIFLRVVQKDFGIKIEPEQIFYNATEIFENIVDDQKFVVISLRDLLTTKAENRDNWFNGQGGLPIDHLMYLELKPE